MILARFFERPCEVIPPLGILWTEIESASFLFREMGEEVDEVEIGAQGFCCEFPVEDAVEGIELVLFPRGGDALVDEFLLQADAVGGSLQGTPETTTPSGVAKLSVPLLSPPARSTSEFPVISLKS